MPTKTDRILGYLPRTFRAFPRPTALYALVDAFGNELLQAENSLAAVMQSHWVDHADRGAEFIDDLARIASLYGLAPRPDESVEEFREHLKRYVRMFLDGTATVQGVLRVVAEVLGLRIADAYKDMDTWLTRGDDELVTIERRGDDAAKLLFGVETAAVAGQSARPASIVGTVDLSGGADLRGASVLSIKVDAAAPVDVDLAGRIPDLAAALIDQIRDAINSVIGLPVASHDTRFLTLASPTVGPASRLEVQDIPGDAAPRLLGLLPRVYHGADATSVRVTGTVDLSSGVDLSNERYLRLLIDGTHLQEIDCAGPDPAQTTLAQVRDAINNALGINVANHDGHSLTLTSPTKGFQSSIAFQRPAAQDATERLFGPVLSFYTGRDAQPARVSGSRDVSRGIDLSERFNIQLRIDGGESVTIDCKGPEASSTRPADIIAAINLALGAGVASTDGRFVTLASPTVGAVGEIVFEAPSAADATEDIFGIGRRTFEGALATTARLVGEPVARFLRIGLDDQQPMEVDVLAGTAHPVHATLDEIKRAINDALGPGVVTDDGRHIILTSPTTGTASRISFYVPAGRDATMAIFGITPPREYLGAEGANAQVVGTRDLSSGVNLSVNLWAQHVVRVAVDGGPPMEVDVRAGLANPVRPTLDELVAGLNAVLGSGIASHDRQYLILTSPTVGSASRIAIEPLEMTCRRRFVTRAFVTGEATQAVFGFFHRQAQGTPATPARVAGSVDLSRGVDLREARFLRMGLDAGPAKDVDFAADPTHIPRPRAAMPDEIVSAINATFNPEIASHDGHRLVLTSPMTGASSRIAFEPPRGADALDRLLGVEPGTFRGKDATRVSFVGTADLSAGVDLLPNAAIKIGIDAEEPREIVVGGPEPVRKTLNEIVIAINVALEKVVASHNGRHVILTSPSAGGGSRIKFQVPSGPDVTKTIFGIAPPREYKGADAEKAKADGVQDLSGGADLSIARFLRIAVDGRPPIDVDCVDPNNPAQTTLEKIKGAIDAALGEGVASHDGSHLVLSSLATGGAARLDLLPYAGGDARAKLLGDVPDVTMGTDPAPAVITGEADLLTPVNLAERRIVRLAVDGGRPVEVEVAGAAPEATFLDEIVEKINATFPGLASATEDDRLRLTSPTRGENSRLEVLPLRTLEVVEYPPEPATDPPSGQPPRAIRHGDRWFVNNDGAADTDLVVELSAPQGVIGPELVNLTTGQRIRLMVVMRSGQRAKLWRDPEEGLRAEIIASHGTVQTVPGSRILAGPLGAQAWVPFVEEWRLSGGDAENAATLQLNNPLAQAIVVLRARRRGPEGNQIAVKVTEAALPGPGDGPIAADGQPARLVGRLHEHAQRFRLVNAAEETLAILRPGPGVVFEDHRDRVVAVSGSLHAEEGAHPLMIVERIVDLFDVTVSGQSGDGAPIDETYGGVAIGLGAGDPKGLTSQINAKPSELVVAAEVDKAVALTLPRGRAQWVYLDCYGARFNRDRFNEASFVDGLCLERGVFNISRFVRVPPEPAAAVFAPVGPLSDPPVGIRLQWSRYRPGSFIVNLPSDLPEQFGGRFNYARFGRAGDKPEIYEGVVTEPDSDPDYLATRVSANSTLVEAKSVDRVPLGWEAMTIPFRKPRIRTLAGGKDGEDARLYLAEQGVPGFIELRARKPGPWGNGIAVTVRKSGPARFDVTIGYQGARFENARQIALAGRILKPREEPIPALTEEFLKSGPVGVVHAKAAGVHADVTRNRAESMR